MASIEVDINLNCLLDDMGEDIDFVRAAIEEKRRNDDLRTQRLLIELPCNTGRFIYVVDYGKVYRCYVTNTLTGDGGIIADVMDREKVISYAIRKEDIGKRAFLSEKDAIAALEKLKQV